MMRWLVMLAMAFLPIIAVANDSAAADKEIQTIYQTFQKKGLVDPAERIEFLTLYFKDRPYYLGSLGEGDAGQFDQSPLYRTDQFDCVTFCSTLLALANAQSLADFQKWIHKIRYHDGYVNFLQRNHFMTVDWNPNNIHNGLIQDVTNSIIGSDGEPLAKIADTVIDKPSWFKKFEAKQLKLNGPLSKQEKAKRVALLHEQAQSLNKQRAVLLYIPISDFFDKNGKARPEIFGQIPSPSVIEIVRPDWPLKDKIGTNLHVSHLGFAVRTSDGLRFRVASSKLKKIADMPLSDYLRDCLKSPTIKGITILKVT